MLAEEAAPAKKDFYGLLGVPFEVGAFQRGARRLRLLRWPLRTHR
jgi:hypothetical protein